MKLKLSYQLLLECVTALFIAIGLAAGFHIIPALAAAGLPAALPTPDAIPPIALPEGYAIETKNALGIIDLIVAAIGGFLGFLMRHLFGPKGKVPLTPEMQTYINLAVNYGLQQLRQKAKEMALDMKNPTVKNKLVADTANAILSYTPLLFQHFGLTPESAQAYIEGKLHNMIDAEAPGNG